VLKDLTLERLSPDPHDRTAVAEFDGKGAGLLHAEPRSSPVAYIHHIAYEHASAFQAEACYIKDNLEIAHALYPESQQMVWTQASLRDLISARFSGDVVLAFDRLQTTVNRSELGRYCLLYAIGGLYVDPWLRLLNPLDVPPGKDIACFRSAKVTMGASWSVDTGLLYATPGQAEIGQLIEQIAESSQTGALGAIPASVTGSERLGRLLAVAYEAKRYFGGEIVRLSAHPIATTDAFLSQDGQLVAIRKGQGDPIEREYNSLVHAWHGGSIYHGSCAAPMVPS